MNVLLGKVAGGAMCDVFFVFVFLSRGFQTAIIM